MQEKKDFTLIKGRYLLAACDGSDINICPNAVRANRKGKIRVSRKGTMNSQEKRDIKPY